MNSDELKRAAAAEALSLVESGMRLGLGTGSTVRHFVDLLGDALREGRLRDITGVPTSIRTEEQARAVGVSLVPLGGPGSIDLAVDGADEVAPGLNLIKGLGAALLREKMVVQASRRFVVISDDSKLVTRLGARVPLPVEVIDWSLDAQRAFLESTGATVTLRTDDDGRPVVSDNGNVFLDCRYPDGIEAPAALERTLLYRAGVVDTGLFLEVADAAVIAGTDGVRVLARDWTGVPST